LRRIWASHRALRRFASKHKAQGEHPNLSGQHANQDAGTRILAPAFFRGEPSCRTLPPACGPFRLNLNGSLAAGCVMQKTAPLPIFRPLAQSSSHRILMNVVQLFHELLIIANIEIVVSLLPEMLGVSDQTPSHSLFERLQGARQSIEFRFAYKQVNVFRHYDVRVDAKAEAQAHSLKCVLKSSAAYVA
jgi:hypothetical protein